MSDELFQPTTSPSLLASSHSQKQPPPWIVQATVLAQGSGVRMQMPGSLVVREVFDVPAVFWSSKDQKVTLTTRMVVTRHTLAPDTTRPSVGYLHQGWVYELFVLDLEPSACSAAEAVSLYLGRGLLECALGQEDQELPTDRWICSEGRGQDLFQRVCQWVWNHRVVLGCALLGHVPMRHTEWTVEVTAQDPVPLVALPTGLLTPSEPTSSEPTSSESTSSESTAPQATPLEATPPSPTKRSWKPVACATFSSRRWSENTSNGRPPRGGVAHRTGSSTGHDHA